MNTKLTTYRYNPIANIERLFNEQFNILPIFHDLEEVYKTGDTVRFSQDEKGMTVDIDLPGVKKEDTEINVDSNTRDVFISAKKIARDHQGQTEKTFNRSFTIGREYDISNVEATQVDGVLTLSLPRVKKDSAIKKVNIN